MVKVVAERLPESQVLLNIEVEPERVAQSVERAFRSIVGRVNIPGFRRGKAPRQLVERYIGREALIAEGIERLLDEVYREAVQESGIRPVARPEIDVSPDYELGNPLQVRATVAVFPTVELGDYQSIRMPRIEVDVTPEEVNAVLDRVREQQAEWVPVERPVQLGDRIVASVRGRAGIVPRLYGPGGEMLVESEGGKTLIDAEHEEFEVGSPLDEETVPGVSERLVGTRKDQSVTIEIALPEDYPDKEVAGKNAVFAVTVEEIKEKRLPELNDEFAKSVGDAETLEELRQRVYDTMKAQRTLDARREYENALLNAVIERSHVELPPPLVSHEIDHMLEDLVASLRNMGLRREDYFRMRQRSEPEIRAELRDDAERRLTSALVLDALADAEKIEVTPAEIDAEIDRLIESAGSAADEARRELSTEAARDRIEMTLRNRKVFARLEEIANQPPLAEAATTEAEGEAGEQPAATEVAESARDEQEEPSAEAAEATAEAAPSAPPPAASVESAEATDGDETTVTATEVPDQKRNTTEGSQ